MITPVLVTTNMMIADVFTKAVEEEIFHRCKHALRNTNRESYITGKISRLMAALARARAESAEINATLGAIADIYTELGDLENAGKYYDMYLDALNKELSM